MSKFRQNINIELAEGSKNQLEIVRNRTGMTQKELVGRIINWFSQQDRTVQQIILGQIPQDIAVDVAKLMLEKMARESRAEAAHPRESRRAVAATH